MKRQNRFLGILLIVALVISLFPGVRAEAASANVTIALSSSSIQEGGSLTVTVTVKCADAIGSYSMAVTYDSSVIEYTGGSGSGGGGTVNIAGYGDGSAKSLKASLKFKAVGSGSTTISTTGGEAYTWDENAAELKHAGAKVTVEAQATASTDNALASLSVSPGKLSPAFSPDVTRYTVSVDENVDELVVSAAPHDAKASVSVSGNKKLKAGDNNVKVTVTAESGDKKTYTIICTKKAGAAQNTTEQEKTENTTASEASSENASENTEQTEVPEETITVLIDGVTYTFADSAEGLELPAEFTQTASVYKEQEILAFTGPGEAIMLVCLLDASGTPTWFMYDELTGGFLAYREMQTAGSRLFVLKADDSVEIPAGYRSVEMDLNGVIIPGFINESSTEIILVYAKKLNGEEGLYYYDTIEGGFIRYIAQETDSEDEPVIEASVEPVEEAGTPAGAKIPYETLKLISMCSLLAALFLLFVWTITLGKNISLKKTLRENEQETVKAEGIKHMDTEVAGIDNASADIQKDGASANTPDDKPGMAAGKDTDEKGNDLEEKAAALVSKLALDQQSAEEKTKLSRDTAPVPTIQIDDEDHSS
ncbi:MAG: cadherin-like beta sandwich domain-containing protein [Lachnospiraceae bacterium]|nr:cadherin-like beta sandwich domain-containing protein [Lachnospiraceae bacterium]